MQNLTECARRHYIISKKLLRPVLRCNTGKHNDSSRAYRNSTCKIWTERLFVPVPFHASREVFQDLQVSYPLLLKKNFIGTRNRPAFTESHSVRFFHTTKALGLPRQVKKEDEKKSSDQNEDPDKDRKPDKEDPDKKKAQEALPIVFHLIILVVMGFTFYYAAQRFSDSDRTGMLPKVAWNEFIHRMLAKGEVKQIIINTDLELARVILHDNAVVYNKKYMFKRVYLAISDLEKAEEKIREAEDKLGIPYNERVPIIYERSRENVNLVSIALLAGLLILLTRKMLSSNTDIMKELHKRINPTYAKFTLVEPSTGKGIWFSDVAGLQEAKIEVMEFVDYLKNPERYRTLGAKIPKGVLLLGPPGCGKTMLAKAVATESNVPFLSMNGCEFVELLGGLGAARVRSLFEEAKKRAPSIIYIDEIDAFAQVRATNAQFSNNESERTLIQFLVEMDGMATKDDVVILASTNRADVLDKALLRRGRFDRHILIDLPTQAERKEIFEKHLASLTLHKPPSEYSDYLSSLTPGFTGADIANVCNEAALCAARLGKKEIYGSDLMYAVQRARSGPSKTSNAMSPMETRIVAYREAGFALLTWMLKHTDPIAKVTIVPTTSGSLGHTQILESLSHALPLSKIEDITCSTLGSRVTENLVFGHATDATKDYLKTVTDLVYKQVAQYGMSPVVGLLSFEPDRYKKQGRPFSKKLESIIDAEVRRIIMEASNRAEKLVVKHRRLLNALAEELLKRETLYYEDIERLIGPPPYPKKRPHIPPAFMDSMTETVDHKR